MDIATLQVFVDVFRAGSFSAVARAQNVTPSSISRTISSLESDLGSRLFQRTTRRLSPTEAGARFYTNLVPILEELRRVRQEVSVEATHAAGVLRVSASVAFGELVIVPRLKALTCAHPDIELELDLSDRRVDIVAERFDLVVRHGDLADSSLVSRRLRSVRYHLVASPSYLAESTLAGRCLEEPHDVRGHRCITFSLDAFRRWSFRKDDATVQVELGKRLTINGALGVRACALDGIGLALLPDWSIADHLADGSLVALLPQWEAAGSSFESNLWLMYPSRAYVPAKVRAFESVVFG